MPPLAPSPGGRLDLHHGPLVNYVGRQKRVLNLVERKLRLDNSLDSRDHTNGIDSQYRRTICRKAPQDRLGIRLC